MLPEPSLSLTLPSLHDDTVLSCRVYHPLSLTPSHRAPRWRKHAAVVAHPYAPLGGSCDDPVVGLVASALLRLGFLVATFGFRGSSGSDGRTSWTGRGEVGDYRAVVGFVVHYVHFLDPFPRRAEPDASAAAPVLILGGYSYGSLITRRLPPVPQILEPFSLPALGSAASEIRLRAEHLARQQNTILASVASAKHHHSPSSPRHSLGVRVGGDETRRSHDSSRSSAHPHPRRSLSLDAEDKVRRGVNELLERARVRKGRRRSEDGRAEAEAGPVPVPVGGLDKIMDLEEPRVAYLLVSPLQGLVAHLATMSFSRKGEEEEEAALAERKLEQHPTLAVFGDRDGFVAVGKLREWAGRMKGRFESREVTGAGHFWVEEGVAARMRGFVEDFATRLVEG